jgi:hypothetical protein
MNDCKLPIPLPADATISQKIQNHHARRTYILCRIAHVQKVFTQLGLDLARDSIPAAKVIQNCLMEDYDKKGNLFKMIEMAFLETSRSQLADLIDKLKPEDMGESVVEVDDLTQQLNAALAGPKTQSFEQTAMNSDRCWLCDSLRGDHTGYMGQYCPKE